MPLSTKIELAVQMTCDSCVDAIKKCFEKVDAVKNIEINLETGSVVVDTTLSTAEVLKICESTGRKAVVKGYGGIQAGVSILECGSDKIKGVVRFVQVNPDVCLIDGTVDFLKPGQHKLEIHESGDISKGCESVGECFQLNKCGNDRVYGDLGMITAQNDGRTIFRVEDNVVKLSDIIGRSLVVTDGTNQNKRLVCGIIARSSGLFENPKTICACDGVSIWDERESPKSSL